MNNEFKKFCTVAVSMVALLLLSIVGEVKAAPFVGLPHESVVTCLCNRYPSPYPIQHTSYWMDEEPVVWCVEACSDWGGLQSAVLAGELIYSAENPDSGSQESGSDTDPSTDNNSGACSSVPTLDHFTISESSCQVDKVYVKFTPTGDPGFYLHAQVDNNNGNSILSAWCTGDASLCKAVGNGQACSGSDYTGVNAWCYKGAE